jgi:asparagine synthetase B (glutamine-hydrolysing)
MCGIFGLIGENLILRKVGVIEKMVSSIHQRGPNSNGCWENDKCRSSA